MPVEYRLHARCGCASAGSAAGQAATRPFALPSSTRHFERDLPFAIEHLAIDVALDVDKKRIRATAQLIVRRVDPTATAIDLDAVGFEVGSVTVDGQPATFRYDGRMLSVTTGDRERARVGIEYGAVPRRGLYFLEPDEHYPARPRQVWSQCQEEDARHWIPCHDSPHLKMTTELTARVPHGWYALSNGALVSSDKPEAGGWTYHWKMDAPHPSYLMTLVAGEFDEVAEEVVVGDRAIPLTYLVPKGRAGDVARTFGRTKDMMRHFSEVTGVAYPWNKYAQIVVSDFIFGGMENTTATTMYEHILLDERAAIDISSDDLVAHELAHQWFGDYVTCRAWYEGWLNEGFATFLEHVWREAHLGADEYAYGLKADFDGYVAEARTRYRRPIVCQDYDAPLDLFDRHLYEKGGLVLHALRTEVGDSLFWRGIGAYLRDHARSVVETRDLQRAIEAVSGRSLGRFFEQWVYKPGHPEIDIDVGWERGILSVAAKQVQSNADGVPPAFDVLLELHVYGASGASSGPVKHLVRLSERQQTFALPVPARPAFVVVDPAMRIIGEVRVKAPADLLRAQLAGAPTARGRWLAAQALARFDDEPAISALGHTLADDGAFWGVRAECAAALGKIGGPDAFATLRRAATVTHPKVRRAVADALGNFRTIESMETLKPLALRDDSYLVEAEAARALGRTRQTAAFDTLLDLLERASWFDVVRAGAIDGLGALRDDRAVSHLGARVRYGHPARVRRASIMSLPKIATDRKTREAIELLLDDSDPLVRIDAVRALGELGDAKARPALRDRLETDLDARVRRRIREVLRDLAEPKRGSDALRDELEKLQTEHAELKARLAKIEARVDSASGASSAVTAPPPPKGGTSAAAAVARAGKAPKSKKTKRDERRGKRR
jgi:aminopeptidase N